MARAKFQDCNPGIFSEFFGNSGNSGKFEIFRNFGNFSGQVPVELGPGRPNFWCSRGLFDPGPDGSARLRRRRPLRGGRRKT